MAGKTCKQGVNRPTLVPSLWALLGDGGTEEGCLLQASAEEQGSGASELLPSMVVCPSFVVPATTHSSRLNFRKTQLPGTLFQATEVPAGGLLVEIGADVQVLKASRQCRLHNTTSC